LIKNEEKIYFEKMKFILFDTRLIV